MTTEGQSPSIPPPAETENIQGNLRAISHSIFAAAIRAGASAPWNWVVSEGIWQRLNEGYLDQQQETYLGDRGSVPTLWGRPLIRIGDMPQDMLEFNATFRRGFGWVDTEGVHFDGIKPE